MRGQQHFAGTPSFLPLYQSDRSSRLPETLDYLHGERAPQWADVLVDFRLEAERIAPWPETLPVADRVWPSTAPGWTMAGYVMTPDGAPDHSKATAADRTAMTRTGKAHVPLHDGVSVLLITDPSGFRFGFAVSADKPARKQEFATGRMAALLPSMHDLMVSTLAVRNTAAMTPAVCRQPFDGPRRGAGTSGTDTLAYDVEVLRDAVRSPAAWLGLPDASPDSDAASDIEALTFTTPFRALPAMRALVAWSLAGRTELDEETRGWVDAGLDPVEVSAWLNLPTPGRGARAPRIRAQQAQQADETQESAVEPVVVPPWPQAEIAEWFAHVGGGRQSREYARDCRRNGLNPLLAKRWHPVLRNSARDEAVHAAVRTFETHGWTLRDVARMQAAITEDARTVPNSHYVGNSTWVSPVLIAEWAFLPVETAITHLRAGLSVEASRAQHERGEMPDEATLAVLAGLRQPAFSNQPRRWRA
jgi:hypothetical protein